MSKPFIVNHWAQCVCEYKANGINELSLSLNEIVFVVQEVDLGWSLVTNKKGEMGYVPTTFLHYCKINEDSKDEKMYNKFDLDLKFITYCPYQEYYQDYKWKCVNCTNEITTLIDHFHCLNCGSSFDDYNLCLSCYQSLVEHNFENFKKEHESKFGHEMFLTRYRKHPAYYHWLISSSTSAETISKAFTFFSDRPCLGQRKIIDGKLGEFEWFTFGELFEKMKLISSGLKQLNESINQMNNQPIDKRGFVGISSKNRVEWFLTDWSCNLVSLVTVPLHTPKFLSEDLTEASHIINNAETSIIVCSQDLVSNMIKLGNTCPSIKAIICMDNEFTSIQRKEAESKNIILLTFMELMEMGKKREFKIIPTPPHEISTIVYTSGSTGVPKGAIVTEEKWNSQIQKPYWSYHPLVCVSFAPLAHMSDRLNTITTIINGGRVGICSGDMSKIFEEIPMIGPIMISSTPRLYNQLYSEYQKSLTLLRHSKKGHVDEEEVMKDFSKAFGPRLKALTTGISVKNHLISKKGGAPTSEVVLKFLKDCFKCPVYNGYASTECGSILLLNSTETGMKHLFDGVQIKLVDVPELGYYTNDVPFARGEICVKSKDCISGYYKNEELTKELIDEEGWYHTGDIGMMDENGFIKIIDRKKNIFKLAQGEYVAPEPLENLYLKSEFVDQIFVYGDSLQNYVVAVVVPNEEIVKNFAKKENIPFIDYKSLLSEKKVYDAILGDLAKIGIQAKRPTYEIPKGIILESEKFTPENGLLTSSFKPARVELTKKYKSTFMEMYQQMEKKTTKEQFFDVIKEALGVDLKEQSDKTNLDFQQLGGDSLTASRVTNLLQTHFKIHLSSELLLKKDMTLDTIVKLLETGMQESDKLQNNVLDLEKECSLDESIYPNKEILEKGIASIEETNAILLTGVTGFIGPFLLNELLLAYPKTTKIYCLIRANDDNEATLRLYKHILAMRLKIPKEELIRIIAIKGDFTLPNLGLSDEQWDKLSNEIDVIYHNGALVNSVYDYWTLKQPNVIGTLDIIRLACQKKLKAIHYVSTIGVLGHPTKFVHENDLLNKEQFNMIGGYPQSKWVAEHLIIEARKRGVPITIFRPGLVGPHSKLGSANIIDWFIRFLCGIIDLRACPIMNAYIKTTPVDFVAKALVYITTKKRNEAFKKQVFHLLHPKKEKIKLLEIFSWVESFGFPIKAMKYDDWFKYVKENCPNGHSFYPIIDMFQYGFPEMEGDFFGMENTQILLKDSDIDCPMMEKATVHELLNFLIGRKCINKP